MQELDARAAGWAALALRPNPRREGYGGQGRLGAARRDVDQQAPDLAVTDGLQMLCHGLNYPAGREGRGVDVLPARHQEVIQALFTLNPVKLVQDVLGADNAAIQPDQGH